jgi:hypothetical protein
MKKILCAMVASLVLASGAMAAPTTLYCDMAGDRQTGEIVTAPFSRLYISREACEAARRSYWEVAGTGELVTMDPGVCICRTAR